MQRPWIGTDGLTLDKQSAGPEAVDAVDVAGAANGCYFMLCQTDRYRTAKGRKDNVLIWKESHVSMATGTKPYWASVTIM